ncbi:MAG: LamG domain-containing protein [Bacteroidetes bacterium]|nr:MAG: LamG domain-containing protein [Bacteroidota bacterium]
MKNLTMYLIAFLFTISLYAEKEPILIFYFINGSSQSYNINEIENISFNKSEISSLITVFGKADSMTRYFDVSDINQIIFENQQIMIILTDTIKINLYEIDSITIKQKEQKFITVAINNEILNLNKLKVSSYSDYNKQFDSLGIAKVLITRNGLPQTIMVSDTGNNLIALGIAKSTDSAIYINGFSSISALVYQNAYMMGMTLEQGADSVIDFIRNLGEVHFVSSFIDDTINAGRPFMNALDSNFKAILRGAFIKTYVFATGDTITYKNIFKVNNKNSDDVILNEKLEVYPSELQSEIKITAEKRDNNDIFISIKNLGRRHINIRESSEGHMIYQLGPNKPILGNLLSLVYDKVIHKSDTTFLKQDGFRPIHTVGMSTNLNKVSYPNSDDIEMRRSCIFRTCFSMWLGVTETVFTSFIPIKYTDPKWIGVINNMLTITKNLLIDLPELQSKIDENDLIGILYIFTKKLESLQAFWEMTLIQMGYEPTSEILNQMVALANILFKFADIGFLANDLSAIDEYNIFNIILPSNDIEPPQVEVISPTERNIKANSIIPINLKLTDNENVKKVQLILDYTTPFEPTDYGNNAGKEKMYNYNWNNTGLIGWHTISVSVWDESDNHNGSTNIKLNISNNPNDKTKPTITLIEPNSNKVPVNSIIPITIKATDDNSLLQVSCFIDNKKMLWTEKFENISLKDTTFRFNWITCNLPIGSKHNINVFAVDGNYNTTSLGFEVEIIQSDDNISLCGLTSYYPFNGNANDEGGNGNHGTVYGATLTTNRFGHLNSAYSFNGTSDDIKLTGKFGGGREMSVSAWFNVNGSTGTFQGIFESEGGYTDIDGNIHLQCNTTGNNVVYYNTGHCLLPIIYPSPYNEWRHVVITAKSGDIRLYENGELKSEKNNTFEFISESNKIKIGSGVNGRYFKGKLDDIRVYNRALTEAEVQELYNEKP